MITMNEENGEKTYRVRVFLKSRSNPLLRVTKQKSGFKNLLEAQREETKLKRECERELSEIESRGILFCDLVDAWYEHHLKIKVLTGQRSKTSHDDYLGSIKKWFGDYLRRPATDLNSYVLIGIFEKMKTQGLSLGHRKKTKQVLKSVFDLGIGYGLLNTMQQSPTMDVVLQRGEEKKPEILTLQEIQTLIQKAFEDDHEWKRIWAVALLTGMREIKSTKAGYWRQVPISQKLFEILTDQLEETKTTLHVFPRHWEWQRGLQAKVLRRFCYIHALPSIKFHTLRACFATQMLRQGVEAAKVMKICGWKELKTMQHYVRLAGIEVHGATEGLEIFDRTKTIERGGGQVPPPPFFVPKENSNPGQCHPTSPEINTSGTHDFVTTQINAGLSR